MEDDDANIARTEALTTVLGAVGAWGREQYTQADHLARLLQVAQNTIDKQEEAINYYKSHLSSMEARLKMRDVTVSALEAGVKDLREALEFSEQNRKDLVAYIQVCGHGLPSEKVKRRMRVEVR